MRSLPSQGARYRFDGIDLKSSEPSTRPVLPGVLVRQWLSWYTDSMNKYRFSVDLVVEVEAFDPFDAEDMIRDAFGLGEVCGLNVVESEVGDYDVVE